MTDSRCLRHIFKINKWNIYLWIFRRDTCSDANQPVCSCSISPLTVLEFLYRFRVQLLLSITTVPWVMTKEKRQLLWLNRTEAVGLVDYCQCNNNWATYYFLLPQLLCLIKTAKPTDFVACPCFSFSPSILFKVVLQVISEYSTLDPEWERNTKYKGKKYPHSFYLYFSYFFSGYISIAILFFQKFIRFSTAFQMKG